MARQYVAEKVTASNAIDSTNAKKEKKTEYLEVDDSKKIDFKNIINNKSKTFKKPVKNKEKENSADFVDDPDVPPLI